MKRQNVLFKIHPANCCPQSWGSRNADHQAGYDLSCWTFGPRVQKLRISDRLIRVSIGIEATEDIIEDFQQALEVF
ncbi:MAG: PLP-dependent transferase [Deltaproteobacteria bacterium]|nr:PLP-dependent transferase [Deltaproteobacteria bacterium]MBT8373589.1 PLP-dependent transferase [Deltaproteobacteria bacterium]